MTPAIRLSLTLAAAGLAPGLAAELPAALSDVAPAVVETIAAAEGPPLAARSEALLLDQLLIAQPGYEFDVGALIARTDRRWFQSLAPRGDRSALLELRRWPGDGTLSFYAVERPGEGEPHDPPVDGEWQGPYELGQGTLGWSGTVGLPPRPAQWLERDVGEGLPLLGGLLVPGDAGLGLGELEALEAQLAHVFVRSEIRPRVWKLTATIPRARAVRPPSMTDPPGEFGELTDPWQVGRSARFTIGLPPGVRARATDSALPSPQAVPGEELWLRGRYVDRQETPVAIGDRQRAGYVARVEQPSEAWRSGEAPPLGAPEATRAASERFPILDDRSDAKGSRVERWTEPGFDGAWMIFRMPFPAGHGYEIGLPVVEGRGSESIYWIALTWRDAAEPIADAPVDPAARFGIRFERLTRLGRKERPLIEGFLIVPGLRVELPSKWWPSSTLRSDDGFPVTLLDREGTEYGTLVRLDAAQSASYDWEAEEWSELDRARRQGAVAHYRHVTGVHVFLAKEGHAYVFHPASDEIEASDAWALMLQTVQLER